ncbi:MAG: DUF255 domain-containing protein [Dehalococcoidia bacterium]|nr:DUF255 domain-containing protein [Dehalococcoidia bacterium]
MTARRIDGDTLFRFSPRPNRAAEVPWLEWDASAFQRAREQDMPVLLSISASWCHWCHVMDETTYSDQRVIDLLASRFVCVRVDGDERPDVDARYNAGGWPTTAFLTPDGDRITAATDLAPDQMLEAMTAVLEAWHVDRDAVVQQVEASRAMRAAERAAARAQRGPGALTPSMLDVALEVVERRYDVDQPGLLEDGARPGSEREMLRFPHPQVLRLWRYAHLRRGEPEALARAVAMARAMVDGGLYDEAAGGFFRYATRPDWSAPHPEKLARDQGALLLAFAELASADADAREALAEAVEGTATYLAETLGDSQGAIAGSQDADEAWHHASAEEREGMSPPAVDGRVFTASAAVAARGLLAAGVAYGRRDWVERGRRVVDFLIQHLRAGEAGMYHAYEGAPRLFGILDDQAQSILAFLEAYEVTGQPFYFEHARALGHLVERDWHEPGMGFRDLAYGHEDTALLAEPSMPLPVNVSTAEGFLWMGRLTHDDRYLALAQEALSAFAHGLEGRGLAVADYARVVDRLLSAEPEFKIVSEFPAGEPDRVADPLHQAALRMPLAGRTVQRLSPEQDVALMYQLGLPRTARVAYVCSGTTCSSPITDPDALPGAVEDLLAARSW